MKCDLCGSELSEVDLARDSSLCADCHKSVFEKEIDQSCQIGEETEPAIAEAGRWWVASLGSLAGFIFLGIVAAFMLPHNESDWFGVRYIVVIGGGILLGALLCVLCALISLSKGEKQSLWAMAVALPCFILLIFCFSYVMNTRAEKKAYAIKTSNYMKYKNQIRTDPDIVLREHWHQSQDAMKQTAFRESFGDPAVHYTLNMLQRIYDEAPNMRDYVFLHPACSREFILAHFAEAYSLCEKYNYTMLASMMKNPNTPIELVEQVAGSKKLVVGAVEPATYALRKRKPNQVVER